MSYYNAERTPGKVVLYLYPQYTVHPPVPFELQSYLTADEWDGRLRVITRTAYRYSKPLLERAWVVTTVLATFLIPMVLLKVVEQVLHHDKSSHSSDREFKARLISFGIFIGTAALFWTPLLVWKGVGRRRMLALVKRWAEADVMSRELGSFVPMWHIRTPGIFDSRTVLTITTPLMAPPTAFHPNAYLPPYLAQPGAAYPPYPPDLKVPQ